MVQKQPQTRQNILQCVCSYTGFVVVTNISFALLNASTVRVWLLQILMFPPSSLALFICTYVTDNFSSFLPSLHPFFNSAHGSIRHHGTVWSLSDFSYNSCCDHVSMGIANHLLRRSWGYFHRATAATRALNLRKDPETWAALELERSCCSGDTWWILALITRADYYHHDWWNPASKRRWGNNESSDYCAGGRRDGGNQGRREVVRNLI